MPPRKSPDTRREPASRALGSLAALGDVSGAECAALEALRLHLAARLPEPEPTGLARPPAPRSLGELREDTVREGRDPDIPLERLCLRHDRGQRR